MIKIVEYLDDNGNSPFAEWFNSLKSQAALKVNTYLTRIENGNFSQVKGVSGSIYECRIDWGPGYRIYFGKDSDTLVILLIGGTKKQQSKDINNAKKYWNNYKLRKKKEYKKNDPYTKF